MEKAHIDSIMITGEVLTSIKPYDFGKQVIFFILIEEQLKILTHLYFLEKNT